MRDRERVREWRERERERRERERKLMKKHGRCVLKADRKQSVNYHVFFLQPKICFAEMWFSDC